MQIETTLAERSNGLCELCSAAVPLTSFAVTPAEENDADRYLFLCSTCIEQIEDPEKTDLNHWRCLNDSMWSIIPAVQVMSWRMLNRLRNEGWTQDLLDMVYLDSETLDWARANGDDSDEETILHRDSNGVVLTAGDTVVLTKDLDVKGAGFTAKRGTPVRNISLVHDNPEQIEGKVNGQQIVLLTKFLKKSS